MENKVVYHENDNYLVVVNDAGTGYDLVNKQTGVIEGNSDVLPHMISEAEQYNCYLLYSSWKWIKRQVERETLDAENQLGGVKDPVGLN